eukprot:scaffold9128_cov52-Attheya_sp.AAC.2
MFPTRIPHLGGTATPRHPTIQGPAIAGPSEHVQQHVTTPVPEHPHATLPFPHPHLRQPLQERHEGLDNPTRRNTTLPPHGRLEGFSQGCPLSSIFTALVLHGVLHQLKQEHDTRTEQEAPALEDLGSQK